MFVLDAKNESLFFSHSRDDPFCIPSIRVKTGNAGLKVEDVFERTEAGQTACPKSGREGLAWLLVPET